MGRTLLAVVILMPILVVFGCIANEFVSLLFFINSTFTSIFRKS